MAVLRILKVADVANPSGHSSQHPSGFEGPSNFHHYWFTPPDNESQATATSSCWDTAIDFMFDSDIRSDQCQCTPNLFRRILYWCKLILIKVGRSYYALPALLLLATLLFGIFIGYFIGRAHANHSQFPQQWKPNYFGRLFIFSYFFFTSIVGTLYSWINEFISMTQLQRILPIHLLSFHKSMSSCCHDDSYKSQQPMDITVAPTEGGLTVNLPPITDASYSDINVKEKIARCQLLSEDETLCESGLLPSELPRHVAVVMDGNRRYGLQTYNNAIQGHWDGSKKLLQFTKWCLAENIAELTVYALSTENWSRDGVEIASLMNIILKHCEELRVEAIKKRISIHIHSTDPNAIPLNVREALRQLQLDTCFEQPALRMNICLSYGSRGEIVNACRSMVEEYAMGQLTCPSQVNEEALSQRLLLSGPPPDILIRTSGEVRLSNFLLWQIAYTELFFLDKNWPELQKDDFLNVIRSYARGRNRRYGR